MINFLLILLLLAIVCFLFITLIAYAKLVYDYFDLEEMLKGIDDDN